MKKTSTRLLSLLLALSLLLTLAPAAAAAPAVTAEAVTTVADKTEPDYETSDNWIWSSANAIHNSVSYFRHESTLDGTPTTIKVRVSAHNHLKFYLNGTLVTGYVSPAPTALPENINYLEYTFTGDELSQMMQGSDKLTLAAAVQYMGNGGMNYTAAKPGLWAEVTVTTENGTSTIVSDSSWKTLEDTPYKGNTPNLSNRQMNAQIDYDAQKMPEPLAWTEAGYDDSTWTAAVAADALTKTYKLRQQTIPEGEIHEEITPTAVGRQEVGYQVFDVGRIATGWVKVTASAPAGTRICIRYSEDLKGDVVKHNVANESSETYCDYYTFSGNGVETFAADFDYKSFRYFEVVGLTELITVDQVTMQWASTGVEYTADFSSSDELLNKIYDACINTQINNLEGMPVDCPHREQSQYLADSQLQYALLSYAFSDFSSINYKTMLDFAAQQFDTGRFTFVAPTQMYASGNSIPEWDLRYSNMLYNYYWTSGDVEGTSYFYDDAVENVNYYYSYLDSTGLLPDMDGWNISDHPEKYVPDDPGAAPTVANILLYDSLNHLSKIAALLGKDDESADWAQKAETLRAAVNTNLLNHETAQYYRYYGDSTTNAGVTAMAINLGVSDPIYLERQMEDLSKPISNTSVVLTYELFFAVMEHGTAAQKEAVYDRIISSWGPMIKRGDSTCWEGFRDENSHSHAWTAYPARIMLQYFLGISYNGVNYTDIQVKPFLPEDMSSAEGKVTVPDDRGDVQVSIQRADDGVWTLKVTNTTDSTIQIAVPRISGTSTVITEANSGTIFANGQGNNVSGLTYVGNDAEYVYFTASANSTYTFTSGTAQTQTGTFQVTVDGDEGGSVLVNGAAAELPYTGSFASGTQVTVEATAESGYAFTGWSGTNGSVSKKLTFTVDGNVSLHAGFEVREGTEYRTVTIDAPDDSGLKVVYNGATLSLPAKLSVEDGTSITLKIEESDKRSYDFVAWSGDIFTSKQEITLDVTDNVSLKVIGSYRGQAAGNLALGKSATFNHQLESAPLWTMANLTDGKTYGKNPGAIGATSGSYSSTDLSANPNVLTLDLAKVTTFDQVCLYPRADEISTDGGVPCYPSTFTISVSTDGSDYKVVKSVTDHVSVRNDDGSVDPIVLDLGEQEARYIRMTTTKINGADNHGTCYVQLHEFEVYNTGATETGKASLTIGGSGKVRINGEEISLPYSGSYDYGTKLAIEAVPAQNSKFSGWTGAVTSSDRMLYLTMDNSIKIQAGFLSTTVSKSDNLALNKSVNVPDDVVDGKGSEQWNTTYLTDGILTSTGATASEGKKGFTSINYVSSAVTDENLWVEIDLGADMDFNQITLYPRTDVDGANGNGESPNFPVAFKVQYKLDGDSVYRDIKTFTDVANPMGQPATFDLGLQNARYIRLIPITLGSPASDDADGAKPYRFQLAEFEVYANELLTDNLGVNAKIESNNSGSNAGAWSLANLVDGQVRSAGRGSETGTKGFTSNSYGADNKDISATPHEITFTFQTTTDVNQVILYPRSDLDGDTADSGLAANFPENFHIDVLDADSNWKTVYTAQGVNNGLSPVVCDFEAVSTTALRLVTTGLGVCACDENSRGLRVQLAEIKIGNVLRGDINEGAIELTADGKNAVTITSYDQLVQLMADVKASDVGSDTVIWSIETEDGFVADFAELTGTNGNTPVLSAFADGSAYVVARLANGLRTTAKLKLQVGEVEKSDVVVTMTGADKVTVDKTNTTFTVSAAGLNQAATVTMNMTLSDNLTDPEVEPLNGWQMIAFTYESGKLEVVLMNLMPGTTSKDAVELASIKAKLNGQIGKAKLTMDKVDVSNYDGEGESFVNVVLKDTYVETEITYSIYDLNHDGVVDLLDLTRAQRWYGTADETCDVDNSGEVNITDMILILNHFTKGILDD